MTRYRYVGVLRRDKATGVLHAVITDPLENSIAITGTHRADGGYDLVGVPGPIPDGLKLPWEEPEL